MMPHRCSATNADRELSVKVLDMACKICSTWRTTCFTTDMLTVIVSVHLKDVIEMK